MDVSLFVNYNEGWILVGEKECKNNWRIDNRMWVGVIR